MANQVVIENPVINSPFAEPRRHYRFDDDGITDDIVCDRRPSSYFIPIARPRKKSKDTQQTFEDWTADRIEENKNVNRIRQRVKLWREGGYPDVTRTTARLLEHWTSADRHRRLFFCQIEAMETLIYITEVAKKYGDNWIENELRQFNEDANPELFRMACKMATGSGKTAVMSMIIAWHTLNKLANPQDARFTDTFLVVTPGITIKDRLRVLLPSDPQNYYKGLEIVPSDLRDGIGKAKILITNYHAFLRREKIAAGKLTKAILTEPGADSPFTESEGEMVRRVCRELGTKKNIVVLNDEAHHCYRRRADELAPSEPKLTGDERKEAEQRDQEARIWISGLEAVKRKIGIKTVYDLSATPFFLRGSGYSEGTLFPWVVSDFSLIDAIESGIVKVPRVPVSDNAMDGPAPTRPTAICGSASARTCRRRAAAPSSTAASRSCPSSSKARWPASTPTTKNPTASGTRANRPAATARRRRCSSSSATTPTCRRWSSTTSAGGRRRWPMARSSPSRASSTSSATSPPAASSTAPTPSSSTPRSSTAARR